MDIQYSSESHMHQAMYCTQPQVSAEVWEFGRFLNRTIDNRFSTSLTWTDLQANSVSQSFIFRKNQLLTQVLILSLWKLLWTAKISAAFNQLDNFNFSIEFTLIYFYYPRICARPFNRQKSKNNKQKLIVNR